MVSCNYKFIPGSTTYTIKNDYISVTYRFLYQLFVRCIILLEVQPLQPLNIEMKCINL